MMINEHDSMTSWVKFPAENVAFDPPSNFNFPAISFEETVRRFRYWKYMSPEKLRSLSFVQLGWRREYLKWVAEVERRLKTTF